MPSNEQARREADLFGPVLKEATQLLDAMLVEKKPEALAAELDLYDKAFRALLPLTRILDDRPKCLAVLKLAESAVCSGEAYEDIFQVERLADQLLTILDRSPGITLNAAGRLEALQTAILRVLEWLAKGYTGCLVHWTFAGGNRDCLRTFEPVSDRSKKNRQALAMGSDLVLQIADQLVREAVGPNDVVSEATS